MNGSDINHICDTCEMHTEFETQYRNPLEVIVVESKVDFNP